MSRPIRRKLAVLAACFLAPLAAACNDNTASTTTTAPSTNPVTDTFVGIVSVNGAQAFPFAAAAAGTVTATLTSITPDTASVVGLALGTWNGTACQLILTNDKATSGSVVTGNVSAAGTLCIRVYDTGNLTASESFQVNVLHP
jgi:hypothetical protein